MKEIDKKDYIVIDDRGNDITDIVNIYEENGKFVVIENWFNENITDISRVMPREKCKITEKFTRDAEAIFFVNQLFVKVRNFTINGMNIYPLGVTEEKHYFVKIMIDADGTLKMAVPDYGFFNVEDSRPMYMFILMGNICSNTKLLRDLKQIIINYKNEFLK